MIGLPDDFGTSSTTPVVTFMPVIRTSDFEDIGGAPQYAIQIGCLYSEDHTNVEGEVSSYTELFDNLAAKGYDPLSLIRGDKARLHTGRRITEIIKRHARSERSYHNIRPNLMALARDIGDAVRDYISGELSIPTFANDSSANKPPLDKSTVTRRERRQERGLAPYDGASGVEEPLMETGNLYNAICYRVIRVSDFAKDYRKKMSASLKAHYAKERGRSLTAREMRKSEETASNARRQKAPAKPQKLTGLDKFLDALKKGKEVDPELQQLAQRHFDSVLSQISAINALLADEHTTFEGRRSAIARRSQLYKDAARFGYTRQELEDFV